MVTIDGEKWVELEDGRLISIHRQTADQLVAEGKATIIPPERVAENEARTGYVLLPEPAKPARKKRAEPE